MLRHYTRNRYISLRKMKNLLYILVITQLVTMGCSTSKLNPISDLTGKYIWTESFFDVSESIEILSDSTFIFRWKQGLGGGETQGKYSLNNGEIKLFSEYTPDSHKFNIIVPPQTKQDYYEILVRDKYSNRLIGATCLAFKKDEILEGSITNEMGICKLPIVNVDSIAIEYLGYKDAGFKTNKNRSPKSLIVEMVEGDHYHYFNGEVIKVSNKNKLRIETFGRNKTFERKRNEI